MAKSVEELLTDEFDQSPSWRYWLEIHWEERHKRQVMCTTVEKFEQFLIETDRATRGEEGK